MEPGAGRLSHSDSGAGCHSNPIYLYRYTGSYGGPRGPTPPSIPQGGAQEGPWRRLSLSMGAVGVWEGHPWRRGTGAASPGRSKGQQAWLVSRRQGRVLRRGARSLLPARLPPSGGVGLKGEPGTFWHLRKTDPQGHSDLAVLPQEGSGYREWVSGHGQNPEAVLEGQFLKGPIPRLGTWGRRATGERSWREGC